LDQQEQMVIEMLDARLSRMEKTLDELRTRPAHCELHAEKLTQLERRAANLETLVGKQSAVAATLGALGAAVAFVVHYIVTGAHR